MCVICHTCLLVLSVFIKTSIAKIASDSGSATLCYTCLREDRTNLNVSCWKDRETIAVNCSAPENQCIDLLLHGSPDFVALRKTCQPQEAVLNPCLFIYGISYQVAGTQSYTVNGEKDKCVCFDICDPVALNHLFPLEMPENTSPVSTTLLKSGLSAASHSNCSLDQSSCLGDKPETHLGSPPGNDLDALEVPWDLALDSGSSASAASFSALLFSLIVV